MKTHKHSLKNKKGKIDVKANKVLGLKDRLKGLKKHLAQ